MAVRAIHWQDRRLSPNQKQLLGRFGEWLVSEATGAGGIGPNEQDRIWSRHLADSMLFGVALGDSARCLDIGSGVGLPGIPLAIAYPEVVFTLLDRSGRRCDLMRRAIGVLGIENCRVVQRDIAEINEAYGAIVSRAAIPPRLVMIHVKRVLEPGGTAVLGLSHTAKPQQSLSPPPGLITSVIAVGPDILDTDVRLLRIRAT